MIGQALRDAVQTIRVNCGCEDNLKTVTRIETATGVEKVQRGIALPIRIGRRGCSAAGEVLHSQAANADKSVAKLGVDVVKQRQHVQSDRSCILNEQYKRDVEVVAVWNCVARKFGDANLRNNRRSRCVDVDSSAIVEAALIADLDGRAIEVLSITGDGCRVGQEVRVIVVEIRINHDIKRD